jgi:lipopolysaccharide/colanic/teichoic acid biosynthesis glycosyltransferase
MMLPVLLVIYIMVRAGGESPIYSQIRVGRDEKCFKIYKFRTIPEANTHKIVSKIGRIRAQWFRILGRFLRRTGLDELPQLINIFLGDMNFFGPRPLSVSDYYKMPVDRSQRTFVRPGLTGLAQVLGGQALDAPQKLNLDLWYIQNKTFFVHLNILCFSILKTICLYNSHRVAEYNEANLLLKAAEFRKSPVRKLVRL